jgi:hypothetical protein
MRTDLKITGKVTGTPTPTVEVADRTHATPRPTETFSGSGNWTMSSLPACFEERMRTRGKLADLRMSIPPQSRRIAPGTVLRRGDCTVMVRAHDIWIARGIDRVRVPPEARLYREGDAGLVLVAIDGDRAEIRHY